MILIDMKVSRASLKLAKSYADLLFYAPGSQEIKLVEEFGPPIRSVAITANPEDIPLAIHRLIEKKYLSLVTQDSDQIVFSIRPELRHWFAFWIDAFTKKFWAGFLAGFASGIASMVLWALLHRAA